MPQKASKKNNWEKERRERFNKAFDELAKVLPGYLPTENLSRVEVLTKSTSTILELQEEINKLSKSSEDKESDKESYKDVLIKKLQDRVKKLLLRNEQLAQLFKDAGIKVSQVFGTKTFKRPLQYSQLHKKIPAQEQQKENDPEKSKVEEANRTNSVSPPKTKTSASNQGRKCSKTSNKTVKPPKPKKFAKVTQNPKPLVLFSRLPTIPAVTQQILLLQNAPVVNNTRSSVVRLSTGPKAQKSKKSLKKHTAPSTNASLSTLGPGTLILANGNIISLVSQPQVIVPPLPLTPTNAPIHSSPNVNRIIRKNQPMKVKSCITNTTQVNKIPIPALTSKYANTSILKKSQEKINKNTLPKVEPVKKTGVKRKLNEKHDKALKKSKSCDNCEKQKDNTNKNDNKIIDKNETAGEKVTDMSETIVATTNTNDTVSNTNNNPSSGLVPTMPNDHLIQEVSAADQTLKLIDEGDKSDKSLNKSNDIQKEVTPGDALHKEDTDKEIPASDTLTPSCVILASSESSLVSCTTAPITVSCTTTTSNTIHEENMKNIDLMHSDLSNDIFASLQVPPGCQNIESTSPTAAFLMAFPIVSSIKVTEVIDEDNSDSQRETPTLLQIGMDNNSKPSNNEALLSLENFSFFNSKDIYYNTKLENSTSEENETEKDNNANQQISNEEIKTKRSEELRNNFEVFSKPDQLDNNSTINQQVNMFNQQDSCNMMNLNTFQAPTNELPGVLEQKNSLERKRTDTEQYNNLIQENLLANSMNVSYNISAGNLCKENIEEINFKDCKTPRGNTVNNITPQEHVASTETRNNSFNPQDGVTFSSNASKMPEPTTPIVSDVTKMRETFQYGNKHLEQTKNFAMTVKTVEEPNQNLEKGSSVQKVEQYRYPVLQNENLNLDNYEQLKNSEKMNSNKTRDNFSYNPKHFLQNEHHINNFPSKLLDNSGQNLQKSDQKEFLQVNHFSSKLLESSGQKVQKSDVNKERDNYQYNPKQFLQNEHQINNFPSKLLENSGQNLQKPDHKEFLQVNNYSSKLIENSGQKSELNKERDTYRYNPKQFLQNEHQINNFPSKLVENSGQNLQKPDQKEFLSINTFSSKLLDNSGQNVQKSEVNKEGDTYQYNPKQFLQNEHQNNNFPSKLVDNSGQSLQKPDQKEFLQVNNFSSKLLENPSQKSEVNKDRDNYQYNPKQFLQNDHNLNMFSTNPVKLPERPEQTVEKSEKNKTYQYNQKHYVQTDNSGPTFASTPSKMLENVTQSVEKSSVTYNQKHYVQTDNSGATFASTPSKMLENVTQNVEKSAKTYHYTNNPFEIAPTTKELSLNVGDRQKSTDTKGIDACAKPIDEKACYFTSNYTSTSYRPNTSVVRSDSSKVCHTGSYENSNKNYTNPFYTNCNYNYADTSFNQNYYKTEKSCYSLNYENYQEYRKSDTTFNRDRRSSTTKEKQVLQNKPVNWMTTTEQKSSDCFLPSFTNQSYSFSSCINSETEVNPSKSTDFSDKRFTWSPSKLPNFLEPSHNFITPTLPTLVGDLALGNALPLAEPKTDAYKCPKEAKRKTYDNQANFLSVSQLVNQSKTDPVPAKTMSRRLSGSKSTKPTTNKLKRCEKTVDKSTKPVNTYSDVFYDQKNRTSTKNISSNYSAEALIGNQCPQEEKKYPPQNIGTYFPSVDDNYVNQNQNFHSYTHNSFQNNSYSTNSFIYTTPISTNYLNNTFDNTLDYSAESIMNYNKNCNNKNSRVSNKEEKSNYGGNSKKQKKTSQGNGSSLANFEYPLLPIQGSTNSPLLPDDFQSHTTFLPPTTPYPCKNTLYQKQGNDFNAAPLLPIPGITRAGIQHPEVSPSLNHVGTSLTNFNLSTIFPEINKGTIPNVHNSSNKTKHSSSYLQVPFNSESKYGFQS